MTSLKSPGEIFSASSRLWPRRFSAVENYDCALTTAPLLRFALNGFIICCGILVVQLLVAIPAAYALAKLKFPGRESAFRSSCCSGLCIPVQVPALPLYIAFAKLGLLEYLLLDHVAVLPIGFCDLLVPAVLQELPG